MPDPWWAAIYWELIVPAITCLDEGPHVEVVCRLEGLTLQDWARIFLLDGPLPRPLWPGWPW